MSIPRKPMLSTISKPFNFTRRFLLASLLLIVLAAALVSYVASDFARRSTLDHNQEKATLIANSLMQQLYRRLIEPRQGAVRSPQAILPSLREIPELDAFVRSQLEGLDVAKLNIIDLNGRVLYSTDPSAVGQDVSKTAGYSAARAGTPWTGLEYGGKVRGLDGVERTADFANVYVPITRLSATATPSLIGVFQIYLDASRELSESVNATQWRMLLFTLGVTALLAIGLLLIVWRADRELRVSRARLIERESELLHLTHENTRLHTMTQLRRLDEQSALLDFSRSFLQTTEPKEILSKAVHTALDLLSVDCATIWQSSDDNSRVFLIAQDKWPLSDGEPFSESRTSLPALIIRRRQVVEMTNAYGDHAFSLGAQLNRLNFRAALGAPLRLGDGALGALVVFRNHPKAFEDDDSRLLNLVANQTAVVLDQIRLYRAMIERERFAASLVRMGIVINSTLDLNAVLQIICKEALESFNVTTTAVWQLDGEELVCMAADGYGSERFLGLRQPLEDPLLLGARVIREQRPYYLNNADTDENIKQPVLRFADGKAILAVPFFKGNEALGALFMIDRNKPDRFTDEDTTRGTVFGQQAAIAIHNAQSYEDVQSRAEALSGMVDQLESTYDATLAALSRALDVRDRETEGHSMRVAAYTLELARHLNVPMDQIETIERGALLHDIGKIDVPDSILRKTGALAQDEWALMREHPQMGVQILQNIPFLAGALEIIGTHQERYDGLGYPRRLRGGQIPLGARIFAVADAFDAMMSDRPYRKARGYNAARTEIRACRGTFFDPAVVDAFLKISPERWEELREKIAQTPDVHIRKLVLGEGADANPNQTRSDRQEKS